MGEVPAPPPPVVTIRGGPARVPPRRPVPRVVLLLPVLAVVAVLALGVSSARTSPPPLPVPAPAVDARLLVAADGLTASQSGVLVVPVVLQDRGAGHEVAFAKTYANPVRDDPVVALPRRVEPGQSRRFVVLLAPDCRMLAPRIGLLFRASLLVQVENGGASQQLVVEVGADPVVSARVRAMCERT